MISDEYVVGLVEGEGCFSVAIQRDIDNRPRKTNKKNVRKKPSLGFRICPSFRITISEKDKFVLEKVREKLGVGKIYKQNRTNKSEGRQETVQYYVQTFKDLLKIREFFQRQTFYTTKGEDFKKWAKILEIMKNKKHLCKDGFLEVVKLREQINKVGGKTKIRKINDFKEMIEFKPKT
jgi:hypothetical protein